MIKVKRTHEQINSGAGQVLVGDLLERFRFDANLDALAVCENPNPAVPNSACVRSYVGCLAEGRTAFAEVDSRRQDPLFGEALKLDRVPAEGTLRQRFDQAEGLFDEAVCDGNAGFLAGCQLGTVDTANGPRIPVDVDVSCLNNSRTTKEGVQYTYRGYDGFAPIFAYVGTEGYMLLNELRPGSQHCQNGTPGFLARCLDALEELSCVRPLFRMDSGNDSADNLALLEDRADYVIKRNRRSESPEQWREIARECGEAHQPRPGKTVWRGSVWKAVPDGDGDELAIRVVFEVTERTVHANGQPLLMPKVSADTYWTSLENDTPQRIIQLYRDHGTSEQYHSEFKGEIGLERLPSGKLATNRTVMLLGMVAYNILRRIGSDALAGTEAVPVQQEVSRRRIRKVIQDLVRKACKFVRSGRAKFIRIRDGDPWTPVFERLHAAYA